MSARKSSSAKIFLIGCGGILPVLALSACADYAKRSDTVTASAGDALAHNMVVHIDDPWPQASRNTRIGGSGQRVDRVTTRYLSGAAASTASPSAAPPPSSPQDPAGSPPAQ